MSKILIYSFLFKIVVPTAFHKMGERLQPKNILNVVDALQMETYGDWNEPNFPRPALPNEAGISPSGQRRYLWTDAFGILNFVSQARLVKSVGDEECEKNAESYLNAASLLIDAIYECLGKSQSATLPMAVDPDHGGFKGLRIGKVDARPGNSDMGMKFDGMYW
jgi:hypothetical protein